MAVPLDNSGVMNLYSGKLTLSSAGTNSGTINMNTSAGLALAAAFTNSGTINLFGLPSPTEPSTFSSTSLNNAATGQLNLRSAYLSLSGALDHSGTIDVAPGASLTLNGTLNATAGSKITGAGSLTFNSPVSDFAGSLAVSGSITIASPITFAANQNIAANLRIASDVGGPGNITLSGPSTWSAGTMSGAGKTTIAAGALATLGVGPPTFGSSTVTLARVLENSGTINLVKTQTSGVTLNFAGGTVNNLTGSVFNISTTQTSSSFTGTGALNNAGILNVAGGTAPFNFGAIPLNNSGVVNVQSGGLTAQLTNTGTVNFLGGTLNLTGANSGVVNFYGQSFSVGTNFNVTSLTNTGTLAAFAGTLNLSGARGLGGEVEVISGATVSLDGAAGLAQDATAQITGAGNVIFANYSQYPFAGSLQSTGNVTINGTVNISTDQSIAGRFVMLGGSLGGAGDITVPGNMDWAGGTIGGSGKLILGPQSVTQFVAPSGQRTLSRQLENAGTFNVTDSAANAVLSFSGGTFTNLPSGTVTVAIPGPWHPIGNPANSAIDNQGLFRLTHTSTLTLTVAVPMTNSGVIEIAKNNTLQLTASMPLQYTHAGGRIVLNGGTFSTSGPFVLQGGSIEGNGTVIATTVTSHGVIDPTLAMMGPYALTFGQLVMASDSECRLDIGGPIQGVMYESISTGANSTLGGNLAVKLVNGFQSTINPAQAFRMLVSATPLAGEFLNAANGERFFTADGFGSFVAYYGAASPHGSFQVVVTDFVPYLAGDVDFDGDVDGADFVVWQTHFPLASNARITDGDADGDGDVDGADFVIWQTNFPSPSPSTAPVPEPAAGSLAMLAVMCLISSVICRRGNKHHR